MNAIPKPGHELTTQLREAVTDGYIRKASKKARYRPKNPDKKPLGAPKLRVLTEQEEIKLLQFEEKRAT